METLLYMKRGSQDESVSTLPIRNGNTPFFLLFICVSFVSTLPIRNGNVYTALYHGMSIYRKYLTYKEYPNLYSQGWNAKTKRRTIDVRHCHL